MGQMDNKVVLITGGASGIGEACAERFAAEGAKMVISDIQDTLGEALALRLNGLYLHHDVADEAQWIAVMAKIKDHYGRLDSVINNAGVFIGQTIEEVDLDVWNKVLSINLTGVMLGCKHGVLAMKANPGGPKGSIVNVSSITGFIGLASAAAYTASKGGVRLLTKSVAVHCARTYKTIRCNSLHPGAIDTPMNQSAFDASGDPAGTRAFFETVQPIGRMATAMEMAQCALFLASDAASFVTGTELVADGGWLAASGPL